MKYESLYSLYYKDEAKQKREYKARFSSPLSRHFPLTVKEYNRRCEYELFYCYTETMALLQDKIMAEFSSFHDMLRSIPPVGITQFLLSCLVAEIKATNDIEGVHSTRREIREALEANDNERRKIRLGGIVGKYVKILNGEEIPLASSSDIRTLYNELAADEVIRGNPNNAPDGKIFRKDSVDIVTGTQKIIHRGVWPESEIIRYMDSALLILNNVELPVFIRTAVFHFLFGYIHPFYDGNGRTSRFISAYMLAKTLHPTVAMQVSLLLKRRRKDYYEMFRRTEAEINKGDLTPFITGAMELVLAALEYARAILQRKLRRLQRHLAKLERIKAVDKTLYDIYDILLQAAIFSDYGASIEDLANTTGKSVNTIYDRLRKMPNEHKILFVSQKKHYYRLNLTEFAKD